MSEVEVTKEDEGLLQAAERIVTDDSDPIVETAPSEPEWTPDYKFKVMDKEYEIDEFLRPAVTKDTYEKVRDLYTKAYGLDHEKARAERYKSETDRLMPIEQQFVQQNKSLGYMGTLLEKKDYATLFKELNIPDDAVATYALDRMSYRELPPEKKQEYDRNLEDRQRLRMLELQNQDYSQQIQGTAVQARASDLDNHLSGPIKSVVDAFDTRVGRQGAFRDEVIRRGQMAYYTQKKDVSVQEAADEVIRISGLSVQAPGQVQMSNTANVASQPTQKAFIPNMKGSNMSPVRKQYSSVADLKKKYDEMFGEQ